MGYAFIMSMHIGVKLKTTRISGIANANLSRVIWASCAVFAFAVLVYDGCRVVGVTATMGQTSLALGLPMWIVYTILPNSGIIVGFLCFGIYESAGFATGLSTLAALVTILPFDPAAITMGQRMVTGLHSFTLLAIARVILRGYLMGAGGIATRLINAAKGQIRAIPGGLAVVNFISCIPFGAVSGSAVTATSAIGSIIIPSMHKEELARPFGLSVTPSVSTLGLLIPSSNVMIIFVVAAGASRSASCSWQAMVRGRGRLPHRETG